MKPPSGERGGDTPQGRGVSEELYIQDDLSPCSWENIIYITLVLLSLGKG
jgi:hypothetical protein